MSCMGGWQHMRRLLLGERQTGREGEGCFISHLGYSWGAVLVTVQCMAGSALATHLCMYLLPKLVAEFTNMAHIDLAARRSPYANYLECVSWRISKPLDQCQVYDSTADIDGPDVFPLTKKQLRTVVLTADPCSTCGCCSAIHVRLPVHRHPVTDDLFETITFAGPTVTAGQLLRRIHHFYNVRKLKPADFKWIAKMPNTDWPWNYRDKVLKAGREGGSPHWIDMMGDSIFFEGLTKEHGNTYSICLGS